VCTQGAANGGVAGAVALESPAERWRGENKKRQGGADAAAVPPPRLLF